MALRTLQKERAVAAMVVLVMALGITSNTVVFTILDAVVLRDLPYHDPARLVSLSTSRDGETPQEDIAVPAVAEWSSHSRTVEDLAMWRDGGGAVERLAEAFALRSSAIALESRTA